MGISIYKVGSLTNAIESSKRSHPRYAVDQHFWKRLVSPDIYSFVFELIRSSITILYPLVSM